MGRFRVGFDARLWHHTGIGRYVRNVLPRLKDVELVVWAAPADVAAVEKAVPGASVRPCPAKPFSVGEQLFFRRAIAREELHLFHAPHVNVPLFCPVPLVVTLHDLIPLKFPGTINSRVGAGYFRWMSQAAVKRAARIIAVSQNTRRDLVQILGADAAKIRVTPEGADPRFGEPLDPERAACVRGRFGLDGRYVLYSGQWKRYKNLETLLYAFAALREKHPELKLALVGKEDPTQPHVPRLIAALGLEDAVVTTGYVDEFALVALYQGASVYAFPSRYEGFGLPPLEAMAAGVPVVSSDAASLPEVVGPAGLLVPPEHMDGWIEALERALTDKALRAELRQRGYERVRTLNWDATATQTRQVYAEVMR